MPLKSRRGAAFGDVSNTGNIEIVVLNVGEPPSVLLNTNRTPFHRVLFKLIGTKMESLEIRWPNGATETVQNVPADSIYTLVEGSGIRDSKPLPPPGAATAPAGVH